MKHIRLLALLSLLLLMALVLTACSTPMQVTVKKAFTTEKYETAQPLVSAKQIESLSGKVLMSSNETLCYLISTVDGKTLHTVYHLLNDKTIFEQSDTENTTLNIQLFETMDIPYFRVVKQETIGEDKNYTTTLYNAAGSELQMAQGDRPVSSVLNLVLFDGECYRLSKDGTMEKSFTHGDLSGALPKLTHGVGDRYYQIGSDGFTIYDRTCRPVYRYDFPGYADGAAFLLSDGNILFQYSYVVPETAKDYDYQADGEKRIVKTGIYQSDSGKIKELKSDYAFVRVLARGVMDSSSFNQMDEYCFREKIQNVAFCFPIENKLIDVSVKNQRIYLLKDSGELDRELSVMAPGQGFSLPQAIGTDRFSLKTSLGITYLLSKEGEMIGEISGARALTGKYILSETRIYNTDLTAIFSYDAQDYAYKGRVGDNLLFTRNGESYLFDGLMTPLTDSTTGKRLLSFTDSYYILFSPEGESGGNYLLCGSDGKVLMSFREMPVCKVESEIGEALLFSGVQDGKTVYYRVK
ncbi:MAG: hypothetical protein SOT42_01775 [Eubacteriales bacterium]|nr:hypothetical protein [Eubacteriales bacterium]